MFKRRNLKYLELSSILSLKPTTDMNYDESNPIKLENPHQRTFQTVLKRLRVKESLSRSKSNALSPIK